MSGNNNSSRCALGCNIKGNILTACAGLCGKEIHPTCAGINLNWCRTREFDEFMIFKCQDCRQDERKNISSSLKKLSEFQGECMEVIRQLAHKINGYELQVKSLVDHIDKLPNSISDNNKAAALKNTETTNLQLKLTNLDAKVADLADKCGAFGNVVSTSKKKKSKTKKVGVKLFKTANRPSTPPVEIPPATKHKYRWIHVSNLATNTTCEAVKELVLNTGQTSVAVVNCLVKKTSNVHQLSSLSFKVGVEEIAFIYIMNQTAIEVWPPGVGLREFIFPKRVKR